jgi:hypothetical protein
MPLLVGLVILGVSLVAILLGAGAGVQTVAGPGPSPVVAAASPSAEPTVTVYSVVSPTERVLSTPANPGQGSVTVVPPEGEVATVVAGRKPGPTVAAPTATAEQLLPDGFWSVCVWCDYGTFDPKEEADSIASRLRAAGLPATVVLSSDFCSLRSGYWVTLSGVFGTRQQAVQHQTKLADAGFDSQLRWVSRTTGSITAEAGFWTVVVASLDRHADAEAVAERLRASGLQGDVLQSSDYTSLNPGYWVAYSGRFADATTASRESTKLRGLGFQNAYPREVRQ